MQPSVPCSNNLVGHVSKGLSLLSATSVSVLAVSEWSLGLEEQWTVGGSPGKMASLASPALGFLISKTGITRASFKGCWTKELDT
jgi:hypothetical protein